ncbi:MAG: UDP-N-acetylmuramoyl-L-alanyl-D-glutamate--2,6-diaminopimelate ligase, partial [Endomicrobiia bacterium]
MPLLSSLIENETWQIIGNRNINVTGISYDSRKVELGNAFFCLHGQHTDGEKFVSSAIENGASVIFSDKKLEIPKEVTLVVVPDITLALAYVSSKFYDFPSEKLNVVGITGTNGKTTITYLLESIFNKAGFPCAVIGTINYRFGDEIFPAETTTPQAPDLQKLLSMAVEKKIKSVFMEVSSHSLALNRVAYTKFHTGIFTNLTRDHLDFHKTFEEYFYSKSKLFELVEKFAIINIDDEWGTKLLNIPKCSVITYGIKNKNSDYTVVDLKQNLHSSFFIYNSKTGEKLKINTSLIGEHNIYNILAASICAFNLNIEPDYIKTGIENVKTIPGRLEKVDCGQKFTVLVDYAHTDDALKNVLTTLRKLPHKRIITVFGCGGDRDRSKRPLMGEVAVNLSDYVIVTSDNPRSEDPEKIVLDIEVGIRRTGKNNYEIIIDREEAIKKALSFAQQSDIVLLAGKGHENYQIIKDKKIH